MWTWFICSHFRPFRFHYDCCFPAVHSDLWLMSASTTCEKCCLLSKAAADLLIANHKIWPKRSPAREPPQLFGEVIKQFNLLVISGSEMKAQDTGRGLTSAKGLVFQHSVFGPLSQEKLNLQKATYGLLGEWKLKRGAGFRESWSDDWEALKYTNNIKKKNYN